MTVWLVVFCGDQIAGVFSSRELAEQREASERAGWGVPGEIIEIEVDS